MVRSTCIVPTEALQQPVKVLGCQGHARQ
jgi:hypothetical protein